MYLICKLLYVSLFSLLSAAPPYLPLYYHDVLGFSSKQIGFVLAIAPFVQSLSCPFWTFIVDKKPKFHGTIMAGTSFLGGIAIMAIMYIGHFVSSNIAIPHSIVMTKVSELTKIELSNTALVSITSFLALTFAFFTSPNMALVDSAVMKILGPNKILYGEQRLWGSISAGLTILLVGQLISMTGSIDSLFWVFGASTLFFVICCFFLNSRTMEYPFIASTGLEEQIQQYQHDDGQHITTIKTNTSEKLLNGNRVPANNYNSINNNNSNSHYVELFKPNSIASVHTIREEADETLEALGGVNLGLAISRIASIDQSVVGIIGIAHEEIPSPSSVFKSVKVVSFLITTLVFGFILSMIVNFLFLFLGRDLHMPASWIGWTGPTAGVTELLCFCFSKQLTERLGVTKMIFLAHIATIIRCLAYSILTPDSLSTNIGALTLQTLHGIGFGVFWATSVSEMDGFFPPEQRSVAQGILGALHFGLGGGLGALTGGYLYEYKGPVYMFRFLAVITALNMILFYIGRLKRFN